MDHAGPAPSLDLRPGAGGPTPLRSLPSPPRPHLPMPGRRRERGMRAALYPRAQAPRAAAAPRRRRRAADTRVLERWRSAPPRLSSSAPILSPLAFHAGGASLKLVFRGVGGVKHLLGRSRRTRVVGVGRRYVLLDARPTPVAKHQLPNSESNLQLRRRTLMQAARSRRRHGGTAAAASSGRRGRRPRVRSGLLPAVNACARAVLRITCLAMARSAVLPACALGRPLLCCLGGWGALGQQAEGSLSALSIIPCPW